MTDERRLPPAKPQGGVTRIEPDRKAGVPRAPRPDSAAHTRTSRPDRPEADEGGAGGSPVVVAKKGAVEAAKAVAGVPIVYRHASREFRHLAKGATATGSLVKRAIALVRPSERERRIRELAQPLIDQGIDTTVAGLLPTARRDFAIKSRFTAAVWLGALPVGLGCLVAALVTTRSVSHVTYLIAAALVMCRSSLGFIAAIRDCWLLDYNDRYTLMEVARRPALWLPYSEDDGVQSVAPRTAGLRRLSRNAAATMAALGAILVGSGLGWIVIKGASQ